MLAVVLDILAQQSCRVVNADDARSALHHGIQLRQVPVGGWQPVRREGVSDEDDRLGAI